MLSMFVNVSLTIAKLQAFICKNCFWSEALYGRWCIFLHKYWVLKYKFSRQQIFLFLLFSRYYNGKCNNQGGLEVWILSLIEKYPGDASFAYRFTFPGQLCSSFLLILAPFLLPTFHWITCNRLHNKIDLNL